MKELFDWSDECVRLCDELYDVVQAEGQALIYLKTDALLELNAKKEDALARLTECRQRLRDCAESLLGARDSSAIEACLPAELLEPWRASRQKWLTSWQRTKTACEVSVLFIQHSQKNLNLLSQDLKRLLGEQPTYSAQGKRVDRPNQGRVVEARY